jgi:phosphodiesterase/alkaline phosphatase D-like protein
MKLSVHHNQFSRIARLSLIAATVSLLGLSALPASAAVTFLGVASGDASSTGATFWTRALDSTAPANTALTLQITTDPTFATVSNTFNCTTDSTKDYVGKLDVTGLVPNTVYYYRFVGPTSELSIVGKVKTAPDASTSVPLHFGFSGDNDGLMRPYALATQLPAQNLDFFMNLGDVIYENASNVLGNNGASWLNSPSVTLSGSAANLNGVPVAGTTFATQAQLKADYEKKYRENFLPVNTGGQNSLQVLHAAQGTYTTWDNHELGNRQYINGGAAAGGSVGGAAGTDMPTGRGVDARAGGSGNVNNVNDVNASATDIMNRSVGFQTLRDVFINYEPIASRPLINAPTDPRTDGTKQLYTAQQWGKNAIFINTDSRSYRDIRIKTSTGAADDTTAPRANNPNRTYLGATQLVWLEQNLLNAQNAGTMWKFVSVSDPIDQLGPIGGGLTLNNLPNFCNPTTPCSYGPVSADGGKAYMGGYRAERNALLKFIADNRITNVVFMSADDHQNRINEVTYSPTGQTEVQSSYVKVPYAFSVVVGPLGATGPDLITNHTFSMAQQYASSIYTAQQAAGVEPLGLIGYPGLRDLVRNGDPNANTTPQAVDFYSPDTFNFTVFDVNATGKTLTVNSIGMFATTQNTAIEYANGPQASTVLGFKIDAAIDAIAAVPANISVTRSGFVLDRRTGTFTQQITLTNTGITTVSGTVALALDNLSTNATLAAPAGVTAATAPTGSPLAFVNVGPDNVLTPGETATVVLQFNDPTRAAITYNTRILGGVTP